MCCPGCGGYTSSVLAAYEDGSPCPYCGLSNDAAEEIITVRERVADEALKARVEELAKELSGVKAERDKLRRTLRDLLCASEVAAKEFKEVGEPT